MKLHRLTRHKQILDLLSDKKFLTIKELKNSLKDILPITLYRDLKELEDQGLLVYLRGAIATPDYESENIKHDDVKSFVFKNDILVKECEALFKNKDSVFVSDGTLDENLISKINIEDLWIYTNSNKIINLYNHKPSFNFISTGGFLSKVTNTFVGNEARMFIKNHEIDFTLVKVDGIDSTGLYFENDSNMKVLRTAIHKSSKVIVLCEGKNISNKTNFKITNMKNIEVIITDSDISISDHKEISKICRVVT